MAWYDRHRRDLPWRRRTDAYGQWVAEVMLQQTRVETVRDYYERFLRRFPDLATLAQADHDEVLRYWQGLGYYRRALHLHRAARLLFQREEHVPDSFDELLRLPGIGDYTAAAIASIAFNRPVAAVDGNVARVLSRLMGISADVLSGKGKAQIKAIAQGLLSVERPGDFNQAWMDLGSMLCTPVAPHCDLCPLAAGCVALRAGRVGELPPPRTRREKPRQSILVGVFTRRGRMLLRKRPVGGLWSGLWEFPNEFANGSSKRELLRTLARNEGVKLIRPLRRMGRLRHELTHRSMELTVVTGEVSLNGRSKDARRKWVTPQGLENLSLSTAHRRVFELFRSAEI